MSIAHLSKFPPINAINCPLTGSIAVEASAGTGKTWLICSMFLRLVLEDNRLVNKILVVTFTNAACFDLKKRIKERLEQSLSYLENLANTNDNINANNFLQLTENLLIFNYDQYLPQLINKLLINGLSFQQLLSRLQLAIISLAELQIFTIHGFCQKILEQIPFTAKLYLRNIEKNYSNDNYLCQEIIQRFWQTNILQGSAPRVIREKFVNEYSPVLLQNFLQYHWQQVLAKVILPNSENESLTIVNSKDNFDEVAEKNFDNDYQNFISEIYQYLLTSGIEQLANAKQQQQQQSPSDPLRKLWQLLCQHQDKLIIATLIQQIYPYILIDEFQDTDQLQYQIFRAIINANKDSSYFLMVVGDPKQAIYRFRQADVYTYLTARNASDKCYALQVNYRSQANLLEAINKLFTCNQQAMIINGLNYFPLDFPDQSKIDFTDESEGSVSPIQCWQIPLNNQEKAENFQIVKQNTANSVANEIARLLGASNKIKIKGKPLEPKDLVVIVATHHEGELIKDSLAKKNIFALVYSTSSIFASEEASSFAKILFALIHYQNISLIKAALVSNILGYSLNDIIELNHDQQEFAIIVNNWQISTRIWREQGIFAAINQLDNHFQIKINLAKQGERALTNFNHLSELLYQAEQQNSQPLQLWRWLRKQIDEKPENDEAILRLETDENLVNIMTIHRVKGLEFPIVFCPFLNFYRNSKKNKNEPVKYHDKDNNLIIDYRNNVEEDIINQVEIEEYAELVRLVYVAITRAKYRCYIVNGHYMHNRSVKQSLTSPLQWLINANQENTSFKKWWNSLKKLPATKAAEIIKQQNLAWEKFVANCSSFEILMLPTKEYPPLARISLQQQDLLCAEFTREINSSWYLTSFSSLQVANNHFELNQAIFNLQESKNSEIVLTDLEEAFTYGAEDEQLLFQLPSDGIEKINHNNPKEFIIGTLVGNFFHYILERVSWKKPESWQELINQASEHFYHGEQISVISKNLLQQNALNILKQLTSCTLIDTIKLNLLEKNDYQAEMEFIFPINHQQQNKWQEWMKVHQPNQGILFNQQQDISAIRGFIDYILCWQGKYYIIDWKSNYLGANIEDYQQNNLQVCIDEHGYLWQSLIYSYAVNNYLKLHIENYHYNQHFGGCLIIFLRGINQDTNAGQYFWRPDEKLFDITI